MTQAISFHFECDDLTFSVASFSGEEGISRLYRFGIDLVSDNADIDVDDLQNRSGRLVIAAGGRERVIQGIVTRTDILDQAEGLIVYRIELVPRVHNLTRSTGNAVYLHRATPDILRGVLEDRLGITDLDREEAFATDEYPRRPFQLQYGETDWAFLSALMEHDGIYYFFRPGDDAERIVFCDYTGGQPEAGDTPVEYTADLGLYTRAVDGMVHNLLARHEQLPEAVEVRNYDDEHPSVPIHAHAPVDPDNGSGIVHFFGQNTRSPEEAQAIADLRAEELACMKAVYHGESTAFHLAAGHRFRLAGHPRERCNGTFQVLSVEHNGHDPEVCGQIGRATDAAAPVYDNRFTALPGDVQFRPPRKTERPRIQGTLNAHIDAEGDGQFAEPDAEGRYHVVFPFHPGFLDEARQDAGKASHWLRLIQPYGGKAEGMHFPLRKGTRVLVGFVGGNPDLPVINGTIPNAEQPSVLQDRNLNKGTIRTPGGNLIEVDDENPRIKFFSPTCRTYMHLGAANAPDDGLVTATDGLSQWMALGGMSVTAATQGWLVESDIWPTPTSDERNIDLEWYTLNEAGARESESEWSIDDTIERFFQFPLKHKRPDKDEDLRYRPYHADYLDDIDDSEDENKGERIVREDELSNFIHTTRKIGEEYSYRSGTDFAFLGPQREVFTFGPQATMDTYSHDADPDSLRAPLKKILQEFGDKDAWGSLEDVSDFSDFGGSDTDKSDFYDGYATYENLKDLYRIERIKYRIERDKRLRREALHVWYRVLKDKEKSLKQRFEEAESDTSIEPPDSEEIRQYVSEAVSQIMDDYVEDDLASSVNKKLPDSSNTIGDYHEVESYDEDSQDIPDIFSMLYETEIADNLNDRIDTTDGSNTVQGQFEEWFTENIDEEELHDALPDDYDGGDGDDGYEKALVWRTETGYFTDVSKLSEPAYYEDTQNSYAHLISEHTIARSHYNDIWEQVRDNKDADLGDRLKRGRLSVSDLASVSISNGESMNYTRGASYSEARVWSLGIGENADIEVWNSLESLENWGDWDSFISFIDEPEDKKKVENIGPNFGQILSNVDGYDDPSMWGTDGKNWESGSVNVSKIQGNTYSFQRGGRMDVQHGNTHSVTRSNHTFTEVINDDNGNLCMERDWKPDHDLTKTYNPQNGGFFSREDVYWNSEGYRKNKVISHEVREESINLKAKGTAIVNCGAFAETTINLGTASDIDFNVGNKNDVEVVCAMKTDLTFGWAGIVELKNTTYELTLPGFSLNGSNNSSNMTSLEMSKALSELCTKAVEVGHGNISARTISAAIMNGFNLNS